MLHRCFCAVAALCVLVFSAIRRAAHGGDIWNAPRSTADGAEISKAASGVSVKPGTDVVVLDEQTSYVRLAAMQVGDAKVSR
jgi:hypothetical protein